jgi:NUMOD3 motif
LRKRLRLHESDGRRNVHRRCARWIRGLQDMGLAPGIVSLESTEDAQREVWWIDEIERRHGDVLNHARVAWPGPAGHIRSEDTRARMSANAARTISGFWRGKHFTSEHRGRIAAALRGNKNGAGQQASAETRARLSAALKGHVVSTATRAKISAALLGRRSSPEAVAKRAAKATGRKHPPRTAEARRRMSEAAKRRWARSAASAERA